MAHVAYATRSGAAEDAAAAIADVMREAGHTVDLADLKTKPSCLNATEPEKRDESLAYNRVAVDKAGPVVASESFPGRFAPKRVNWFPGSPTQVTVVQAVARYVFGEDAPVNGSYDDDTRAVVRTIQQRLGISTPLGEREGWVAFLDGATRG